VYYAFTEPIVVPAGNFYIGTLQQSNVSLNFGLDKNTNANSTQLFYQLQGSTDWIPSSITGSAMIRPVFRSTLQDWVGLETEAKNTTGIVYPNPVRDELRLQLPTSSELYTYRITEMTGKCVANGSIANQSTLRIPVETLSQGCDILHYSNSTNEQYSARFMKH
jgi:hypothetical protein